MLPYTSSHTSPLHLSLQTTGFPRESGTHPVSCTVIDLVGWGVLSGMQKEGDSGQAKAVLKTTVEFKPKMSLEIRAQFHRAV